MTHATDALSKGRGVPNPMKAIRGLGRSLAMVAATLATIAVADVACGATSGVAVAGDTLERGFSEPPRGARPRVWWHWINGNVTKEGIAADLAWMNRVGIGGVQTFDIGLTQRVVVDRRLAYMTPEWKEAFQFAASRSNELGLEMTVASSPGWSETGAPWVSPSQGMKKLVWSEMELVGGKAFHGKLPQPPAVTGPYQKMALSSQASTYYGDSCVLAYPEADLPEEIQPHYTAANGQDLDSGPLLDDSLESTAMVPSGGPGEPPTAVMTFEVPQTIRSARIYIRNAKTLFTEPTLQPRLEVREAAGWRKLADMPVSFVPTTVSFSPVTAREFRVVVAPNGTAGQVRPLSSIRIADLRLSARSRIDRFEVKAGFDVVEDYRPLEVRNYPSERGVDPKRVLDLTARMGADGVLDWSPPAGKWHVLRLGYSLLGVTNHPAAADATGLEVDKYDAPAVRQYMQQLLGKYREAAGPDLLGAKGIRALLTDSIEVGASNWSPGILKQFRKLRGYDPLPWLPALTGEIVGSRAESDRFLYDFRRSLSELIASEHYGEVARAAHDAGLKVYGESQEGGYTSLGDDMSMRSHADVPMAALWTFPREERPKASALADMRGASSVAHVYGRELVAAESMTSSMKPWAFAPADLRRIVDLEFANGINRPVIHTSVHQPVDRPPGISLSVFGQYFNRLETWAEMAGPWITYISRTSYLLQQGRSVADVAYFTGEEGPMTALHGDEPVRYAYDFVNADMLREALSVRAGRIVSTGGASYRALYLGESSQRMTLPVLRRIDALVRAGAVVIGDAPKESPSLADDAGEFARLVHRLWPGAGTSTVGKGKVIPGRGVEHALQELGVSPDFSFTSPSGDAEILFVHRQLDDGDLYFIDNRKDRNESILARFRVEGRVPEVWRADSGARESVSYDQSGADTVVPIELGAEESCFVVFRRKATMASFRTEHREPVPTGEVSGPWVIRFQEGRGAPESLKLDGLAPLNDQPDPGVRYFSGIAAYSATFSTPGTFQPGDLLWLDLGRVGDVAEVFVNGKPVGIAWKPPYRLEIGSVAAVGTNTLEVRVADLWVNRLIGDAQPGAQKITFTIFPTYGASAPLRTSGLIGPVRLLSQGLD